MMVMIPKMTVRRTRVDAVQGASPVLGCFYPAATASMWAAHTKAPMIAKLMPSISPSSNARSRPSLSRSSLFLRSSWRRSSKNGA